MPTPIVDALFLISLLLPPAVVVGGVILLLIPTRPVSEPTTADTRAHAH